MRRLLVLLSAVLAMAYSAGAGYFFVQERWARSETFGYDETKARHPEAMLFAARMLLARNHYGGSEGELLRRAILAAPSFYEGPYLLAAFRENRFEAAPDVRRAYEEAVARYPANGRLHLAYGRWLLDARSDLSAWSLEGEPAHKVDPLELAERRLGSAMALEPDLTWSALGSLDAHRVPPERWVPLVPSDRLARRHLVDALFQAGRTELGWMFLKDDPDLAEPSMLRRVIQRAFDASELALGLAAAEQWLAIAESRRGVGPDLVEPSLWIARAHFAMDEPELAYEGFAKTLERIDEKLGTSSPVSLAFLCSIGDEYLRRQQTASAETWFGEAASRSPSYVPALYGLARSLRSARDLEGAIRYYEQVLRIDPSHGPSRTERLAVLAEIAGR